jgi:integrase
MARRNHKHEGIDDYKTRTGAPRWRVRLRLPSGRRCSRSFTSLDAALNYRDQQRIARRIESRNQSQTRRRSNPAPVTDPRIPGLAAADPMTVGEFVTGRWWREQASQELAPRTLANYARARARFIEPSPLADLSIEAVDAEDILDWQQWARSHGATEEMLRTAQKVLSGAFSWGARRPRSTGVRANPISTAEWPCPRRKVIPYIAEPEVVEKVRQAILNSGQGLAKTRQRDALLLSVMALTGARPGDVRGIRVCDVHFRDSELLIAKTKTGRPRVVPLFGSLAIEIKAWIATAGLRADDALVGTDGSPMSFEGWENWRRRAYNPARSEVASSLDDPPLARARAYDLCRHSYAALQLAALMDLPQLAEIMGHSVDVLASTYAAPLRRAPRRGSDRLIDVEATLQAVRK